jgi:hypothetical protein
MSVKYANCNTMHQVKQLNKSNGYHFFDKSTMGFFRSKLQESKPYGGCVFVTSEQNGPEGRRAYTVRAIRENGSIETLSEFQEFGTEASAHDAAKRLAEQIKSNFIE